MLQKSYPDWISNWGYTKWRQPNNINYQMWYEPYEPTEREIWSFEACYSRPKNGVPEMKELVGMGLWTSQYNSRKVVAPKRGNVMFINTRIHGASGATRSWWSWGHTDWWNMGLMNYSNIWVVKTSKNLQTLWFWVSHGKVVVMICTLDAHPAQYTNQAIDHPLLRENHFWPGHVK